jgi:hypothetical protein
MILSDEHRLAFVHIPKCAGVSVKQPLRAIDSTNGYFSRIADHPVLGRTHYAHIPLNDLAEFFPDEWAKVRSYRSFAVVRDPTERFVSSMFQRLREFKGMNQSDITPDRLEQQAEEVIRYLESAPGRLNLEHVHFNRQVDYICLDGAQVVESVFPIAHMGKIIAYIADTTGIAVEEERKNRSTEIRFSSAKPLIRMLRKPYAAMVPYAVRNRLRSKLLNAGVYGDVAKQNILRRDGRTAGFIRAYYAADFEMHARHG